MLEIAEIIVVFVMGAAVPSYRLWKAQKQIKALQKKLRAQRKELAALLCKNVRQNSNTGKIPSEIG